MVKYMYYYVNILLTKNALNTFISYLSESSESAT